MTLLPTADIENWILLRGLGRERRHWGEFLDKLKSALPHKKFHCLDLPGSGELFQISSPCTVPGIRHQLQQQQQKLGIKGPLGVIGLSLGGMVSLDWMAASNAVAAVVIINSSANNYPFHWRIRPSSIGLGLRAITSSEVEEQECWVLQMGSRKHANDPATIKRWSEIQRRRPVRKITLFKQLLAAAWFSLPDNIFGTPGLVLTSDSDNMVSSRCSEAIADHYGWELYCNVGAGHDIPLDDPGWVVAQICRWVNRP